MYIFFFQDGESTYYNNERQVTQSDGPDIPAQPTKLRPISIKSGIILEGFVIVASETIQEWSFFTFN